MLHARCEDLSGVAEDGSLLGYAAVSLGALEVSSTSLLRNAGNRLPSDAALPIRSSECRSINCTLYVGRSYETARLNNLYFNN